MARIRDVYFICSAIDLNNRLISESIIASSSDEATNVFNKKYLINPEIIHGPFYKKRSSYEKTHGKIIFNGASYKAMYNGWIVNAFELLEPKDKVFLVFIKCLEKSNFSVPKDKFIIPISEIEKIEKEG